MKGGISSGGLYSNNDGYARYNGELRGYIMDEGVLGGLGFLLELRLWIWRK